MFTTKQKAAGFHISTWLAGVYKLMEKERKYSHNWNRLKAVEDAINRLLASEDYNLEGLPFEDIENARKIYLMTDKEINRMYPGTGEEDYFGAWKEENRRTRRKRLLLKRKKRRFVPGGWPVRRTTRKGYPPWLCAFKPGCGPLKKRRGS